MEDKDYIYIYDNNGKKNKMELVLAMNSLDGMFQYIVYKEVNKALPLYMAKTSIKNGLLDLDTNLTEEEKQLIENTLNKKITGGNNV